MGRGRPIIGTRWAHRATGTRPEAVTGGASSSSSDRSPTTSRIPGIQTWTQASAPSGLRRSALPAQNEARSVGCPRLAEIPRRRHRNRGL